LSYPGEIGYVLHLRLYPAVSDLPEAPVVVLPAHFHAYCLATCAAG